jgi:hypothetical protein
MVTGRICSPSWHSMPPIFCQINTASWHFQIIRRAIYITRSWHIAGSTSIKSITSNKNNDFLIKKLLYRTCLKALDLLHNLGGSWSSFQWSRNFFCHLNRFLSVSFFIIDGLCTLNMAGVLPVTFFFFFYSSKYITLWSLLLLFFQIQIF